MFRWFLVCLLLAGGAFVLVAYLSGRTWNDLFVNRTEPPASRPDTKPTDGVKAGDTGASDDPGPSPGDREGKLPAMVASDRGLVGPQPIVIPGCNIKIAHLQQDVPSEREGKILFIGVPVGPKEWVPPGLLLERERYYLAVQCESGEEGGDRLYERYTRFRLTDKSLAAMRDAKEPVPGPILAKLSTLKDKEPALWEVFGKDLAEKLTKEELAELQEVVLRHAEVLPDLRYREWGPNDAPEPSKVRVLRQRLRIRILQKDDWVKQGQLIALVNPDVALSDMHVQVAELEASAQEAATTEKQETIAQQRWDNYRATRGGVISKDDMLRAEAEWQKAIGDAKKAKTAITSARAKLIKTADTLRFHEVHATIDGRVTQIFKHSGEAIKPMEPLVQLRNPRFLQIEGVLNEEVTAKLKRGMEVDVEPVRWEEPRLVLSGHLKPVTCVAVSKGPNPMVVSGGEDRTLFFWDLATGKRLPSQPMRTVPRALACTGKSAADNLLLVGDAAGVGRIFNLADRKKDYLELSERHKGPITCVAFSADGKRCATGGEDQMICIWDTANGRRLHGWRAHHHTVTSLQFTATDPAKGSDRLFSAGADATLVVWDVAGDKTPVPLKDVPSFDARSNDVAQLGATADGKSVLLDQGREIKVLSVDGRAMEGTLANPTGTLNFSTMALFSPDGKMILTNGNAAGRLQLWRAPPERTSELRQLVWEKSVVTCGAFAEDGSAVTGTQDQKVLIWARPVERPPVKGHLMWDHALDTQSRQVRVRAEVEDTEGVLIPGGTATIVIKPSTP